MVLGIWALLGLFMLPGRPARAEGPGILIGERLNTEADRKLVESYLATLEPGK